MNTELRFDPLGFALYTVMIIFVTTLLVHGITETGKDIGHQELGSAGHVCFANHTCRENLTCHHGVGNEVGICLGKEGK
jgi:hypothetical protein